MNPIASDAAEREANRLRIRVLTGIDEEVIRTIVDRFYARIREDALLGPIFEAHVEDWGRHLPRMYAFWNSVALGAGEYDGQPMRVHMPLPIEGRHFAHWLGLFEETVREICSPQGVDWMMERARRIARSLEMGVTRFGLVANPPIRS
ncbi:group III truncated hemoglobin [Acetobacteraceae bacterium H6797]|nr:group III truncated hemoglobin [Acetobacteraceae bacterium H6797]